MTVHCSIVLRRMPDSSVVCLSRLLLMFTVHSRKIVLKHWSDLRILDYWAYCFPVQMSPVLFIFAYHYWHLQKIYLILEKSLEFYLEILWLFSLIAFCSDLTGCHIFGIAECLFASSHPVGEYLYGHDCTSCLYYSETLFPLWPLSQ